MKSRTIGVLFLLLGAAFLSRSTLAVTVVAQGEAIAPIVVPDEAIKSVLYAAEELQSHVEKATGVKLTIVKESEVKNPAQSLVLVGPTQLTKEMGIDPESLPPEGYLVRATDFRLVLVGRDKNLAVQDSGRTRVVDDPLHFLVQPGTLWAVYAFLDRELGVKWLWPGELGTAVPKRDMLRVDRSIYASNPRLVKRHLRWPLKSKSYQQNLIKQGVSQERVDEMNREWWVWYRRQMMGWRYVVSAGHAFTRWWDKYHEEHPDWFAMRPDGGRYILSDREKTYVKLCVSNPQVIDTIYKDGVEGLKKHPFQLCFSASPNDSHGYCMCPSCKAMDDPNGRPATYTYKLKDGREVQVKWVGMSTRYAKVWNQLADRLAADFPDRYLGVYAYAAYSSPPRDVRLRPNILLGYVGFGTYVGQLDHTWSRKSWMKWAQTGCCQFLRPNSLYFSGHGLPFNFARYIGEDTKYCAQRGMLGTDFDACMGHFGSQGINYYVLVRIIADPSRDVAGLIDEYCTSGFGKAAPAIRAYFDRCEEVTKRAAETAFPVSRSENYAHYGKLFDKRFVDDCRVLFYKARLLEDDPTIRRRIDFLEVGLDYAELQGQALVKNYEMTDSGKDPAGALAAIGAKEEFMTKHADSWSVSIASQRQHEWTKKYSNYFGLVAYEGLKGKNVFAVLTDWKFQLDPEAVGEKEGWFGPNCDDREWASLKAGKWWEPQGYGSGKNRDQIKGGYNGFAWYRKSVSIPAEHKGKRVFLRFGGIDESGWVYLNGQKIAETVFDLEKNPDSWITPVVCDITDLISFEKPNLIAVKVEDQNGAGGLWRLVSMYWEEPGEKAGE